MRQVLVVGTRSPMEYHGAVALKYEILERIAAGESVVVISNASVAVLEVDDDTEPTVSVESEVSE